MILEKMASFLSGIRRKYGIGQFCIHFMRIFTMWLCARLGIAVLPTGCRPIPAGHLNFDPAMAREFGGRDGVNRAIIYQYIANWVIYNQEHGKNYVDGRFWSYNSGRAWADKIQLWESNTVEKHIRFLRDEGVLDASAMNAHKGDQRLWYTLPSPVERKESNGGTQISLPLDSNDGMGGRKESNDSSVSQTSNPQPAIKNGSSSSRAHTDAGGVAQFPKHDLDPKEFSEPKPELRDAAPSEDGSREEQASPPVAPAPSPAVPEWMPSFFSGCAEEELVQILHTFGEEVMLAAKKYAENERNKIDNPPGFVRVQLAKGWRPPAGEVAKSGWKALDSFNDLADESSERLQWIISDDCDWGALHKAEARRLLDTRLAVR